MAKANKSACPPCSEWEDRIPMEAIQVSGKGCADVNADKCIGCGTCTLDCPEETLKLRRYERSEKPFDNIAEFFMTIARDNNRL